MKKSLKGFSVAEAMMALLIGSVALGAAAPMITKQVKQSNFSDTQFKVLNQKMENTSEEIVQNKTEFKKQVDDALKEMDKRLESVDVIPTGAIMFFDLASCPDGWTALNSEGAFIRDIGGEAAARGVLQESGVPNLVGFNGMSHYGQVDGKLFTISSILGSKSHKGGGWEVGADFNASGYSDVYKDGLNEVRPKNIAYLACKKN